MPDIRYACPKGIALVLVLWVITLLTVIALSVVSLTRTETQMTRNRLDEARLRASSEAALSLTVLRLNSAEEEDVWYPDGSTHTWRFKGTDVTIQLFNESSRIDLNHTGDTLLEKLLVGVGAGASEAAGIAKRIMDWRDKDDSERAMGAEDASYQAEGLPFGSADNPFRSVAELSQVLGIRPELVAAMKPHVTVHTASARVNQEYASPLVKGILTGASLSRLNAPRRDEDNDEGGTKTKVKRSRGGPIYRLRVELAGGAGSETLFRNGGRKGYTRISRRYDWSKAAPLDDEEEDAPQ